MKSQVVLAGACRTPIGKFGGSLAGVKASELGAIVIREALSRSGIEPAQVDQVVMGCVLQAGLGQNVARQSAVQAGLPVEIPAQTINMVCGSGLQSVHTAAAMIASGQADIVVAGGMENMSMAPYALPDARFGYRMNDGAVKDLMIYDALWDSFNQYHMGITAENVAEQYGITREMQDNFAVISQQKCESAKNAGRFQEEIVPVSVKSKKETLLFEQDEFPRSGVTLESIAKLRPAFKKDGTVTAANASGINDGAAAMVVMSSQKAAELGITPLAVWHGGTVTGVDPSVMGIGPAIATQKLLKKLDMKIDDMDLIEANEAFAAQALAVGKILEWDASKVNVNGGAIALGHPVGASGCRILVSLLYEMKRRQSRFGLATLCIGGGMGIASVIERV